MKNINKIWGIALLAFTLVVSVPHKSLAQNAGEGQYISDQEFYDQLSPYGTWVSNPNYGNVWVPDVDGDFRPYATNGHWVLTSYGNTWVSDYPWGWAAFHYGRWNFDDYYGWQWVPGNEWAPAWVSWRNGDGYYGWAPLAPEVTVEASFGNDYTIPDAYWAFAPYAYINQPDIYNYYLPNIRVRNIIRRTTIIRNTYVYNNRTYISGPRRNDIQRYTKRPVRVYNINNVNRPSVNTVNNSTINIYRPGVRPTGSARPARVVDGAAYRQQNPGQRIGGSDSRRGTAYNRDNAAKLANTARTNNPDTKVVRINNGVKTGVVNPAVNNRPVTRPGRNDQNRPDNNTRVTNPAVINTPAQRPQQTQPQVSDQQRQQVQQQRQQARQTRNQQRQQNQPQQVQQQQQARDQQRQQQAQQQQQARDQQRQQQQALQQRERQSQQQAQQAQQQQAQQRQQQAQAQQQQAQQRQQQAQQAQQQQAQQRQQQAQQAQQQQAQQRQQQAQQAQQRQQQQRQQQQPRQQQARPQQSRPQQQPNRPVRN